MRISVAGQPPVSFQACDKCRERLNVPEYSTRTSPDDLFDIIVDMVQEAMEQ